MATVGRAEVKIVADARGFSRDAERAINGELRKVKVDTDPIRRGFTQGVVAAGTASALQGAQAFVKQFGIILQGGISAKAAGLFGTAVLAALGPVLLVAGTLLGGLLISGMGAALAGIGIFFAAREPQVQNAFAGLFARLSEQMQVISRPFVSTLLAIAEDIEQVFATFLTPLTRAFGDLAPAIEEFSGFLAEAFEALAPTIQPITDAFIAILEELGPALANEVFPDLADAIINLANAIGDNADTFVDILTWFLSIPEAIINFLAELTELAGWFQDNPAAIVAALGLIGAAMGLLVAGPIGLLIGALVGIGFAFVQMRDKVSEVFVQLIAIVGGFVSQFIEALSGMVFSGLRFFGNLLRGGVAIFRDLRDGVIERIRNIREGVRSGFNSVVDFIRTLPSRIASAASGMWNSIWSGFRSVINNIIGGWNRLSFSFPGVDLGPLGTVGGFTIGTPNIPFLQRGGIIERSGAAVVGENGPELVFLPQGAEVQPLPPSTAPQTMPSEFVATAVIDLGNGIKQAIELVFVQVAEEARAA